MGIRSQQWPVARRRPVRRSVGGAIRRCTFIRVLLLATPYKSLIYWISSRWSSCWALRIFILLCGSRSKTRTSHIGSHRALIDSTYLSSSCFDDHGGGGFRLCLAAPFIYLFTCARRRVGCVWRCVGRTVAPLAASQSKTGKVRVDGTRPDRTLTSWGQTKSNTS